VEPPDGEASKSPLSALEICSFLIRLLPCKRLGSLTFRDRFRLLSSFLQRLLTLAPCREHCIERRLLAQVFQQRVL
jgi:hypothetical protein